ncbi:MAG: hypothetical protein LBQ75_02710 [Zoogloeaceae bacterium]|jgi:hypothetical protein|nr:hypothetical protein [Zoogloeaceae bacterium]
MRKTKLLELNRALGKTVLSCVGILEDANRIEADDLAVLRLVADRLKFPGKKAELLSVLRDIVEDVEGGGRLSGEMFRRIKSVLRRYEPKGEKS